ncbi:phosphoprotein P [Coastal Plains virus]|uniref:Phosphoprotein P n=1 Tax=Coastal Plains virus TaxID=764599 RepID=D8V080_9RHAB|nr:phosphoprotein P [Coastal Plains virus]ADG86357.1 phosphoprotein P [Coastal Plains virus]
MEPLSKAGIKIPYKSEELMANTSDVVDPEVDNHDHSKPQSTIGDIIDRQALNFRQRVSFSSSYDDDDWGDAILDLTAKDKDDKTTKKTELTNPTKLKLDKSCTPNDAACCEVKDDKAKEDWKPYPLLEVDGNDPRFMPKLQFMLRFFNIYEDCDYTVEDYNSTYYIYPTKKWLNQSRDGTSEVDLQTQDLYIPEMSDHYQNNEHPLIKLLITGFSVNKRSNIGKYRFDINNPSLNIEKIAEIPLNEIPSSINDQITLIFKVSGVLKPMKLKAKW